MTTVTPKPPPTYARVMGAVIKHLSEDLFGGPRVLKAAWVINAQKGLTAPFVLALMLAFDDFSAGAWTYLALHGSYGLVWLLKHVVLPDRSWEKRVTFGGAFMMLAAVLGPYWVAPVLLVTDVLGPGRADPSPALLGAAVALHTLGVVIMMTSDAQKYFTLRHRRGLITDGMFRFVRHPNYLGEMMLYAAYALLAGHWLPWAILAWVWLGVFVPFMLLKEASMSRHPEWAAYEARTGMLWPWPFGARAPAPAVESA